MAEPLEDLLRSCTVRVTGGPMRGAGFFVAPGKVLTCVHVIGDSTALAVRWERDGQQAVEVPVLGRAVVLADRGRPIPALESDYPDIAVLDIGGLTGHPCVAIDAEWPWREDSFQVYGYPREGGAVRLTPARLTYRGLHGNAPTIFLDLASDTIKPGMSGAPVLNLRSGAVCGVIVASKHPVQPDGALAIPWSAVDANLSEVLAANRAFHLEDRRWNTAAAGRLGAGAGVAAGVVSEPPADPTLQLDSKLARRMACELEERRSRYIQFLCGPPQEIGASYVPQPLLREIRTSANSRWKKRLQSDRRQERAAGLPGSRDTDLDASSGQVELLQYEARMSGSAFGFQVIEEAEVDELLRGSHKASSPLRLVLVGPPGCGKSATLQWLAWRCARAPGWRQAGPNTCSAQHC
jgi:hypothetical protein